MDLLGNAIESIHAGVEDYQEGNHGRLLAGVRSIHAGILLLYKEALRRASPAGSNEALLKARILPRRSATGVIEFVGEGKKTVDVQQIKERFRALNIATDWVRFDRITEVRNEVEHYFTKANKKALESVISDAFIILRNFIANQLNEDPLQLLGEEAWGAMLEVSEVYEAERAECDCALTALDWESEALAAGISSVTCGSCGGGLLRPDNEYKSYRDDMWLVCRTCGERVSTQDFVPAAIAEALGSEEYYARKEGGESPYTICPECASETYVMDEERCALCGVSAEHTCRRCSGRIPAEELVLSPYCGWCEHMMHKDD